MNKVEDALDKIEIDFETECWEWVGNISKQGYGRFGVNGEVEYTHRLIYEMLVEPIPEDLTLDHLCKNRKCCNPDHLEVVDLEENKRRGDSIPAQNARKTHCPQGHPYDEENTYTTSKGHRQCIICRNERIEKNKKPHRIITHCPQGHEYTPENMGIDKRNKRYCRECARVKSLARYWKKKESILNE